MNTLNFLKIQPSLNWLDYFLDRKKLFELLAEEFKSKFLNFINK